jgi:hypothetical protein
VIYIAQTHEVIREQQAGVTPSGKSITREKTEVSSSEAEKQVGVWTFNRFILYLAGVIETLLIFRFTLKILGANPTSPFVSFIYSLSGIFESPFRGIFRTAVTEGIETVSVLEPSTIFAMLIYFVLAIGITQLVRILTATGD